MDRARHWMERQAARVSRALPPPPLLQAWSEIERSIAGDLLKTHAGAIASAKREFTSSLRPRGRRAPRTGDIESGPMEEIAERLVNELRERMQCLPWDRPLLGLVARVDQRLPRSTDEYMDDAELPVDVRRRLVATMDQQTRRAGDYLLLVDLLLPLLPLSPRRLYTVLDVGSGPGGFPVALACALGERKVRVVGSDIDPDYIALGAARARAAAVESIVEFRRLDALHLFNEIGAWRPDMITCTRTLHHFGVKATTRLLALAIHATKGQVFFVDIARSLSRLMMAAGAGLMSGNRYFAHDAVVSVSKALTPTELRLVAACIPGGEDLDVAYTPPAYVVARPRKRTRRS